MRRELVIREVVCFSQPKLKKLALGSAAETLAEEHLESDRRDSDGQTASSLKTCLESNLADDL